LFGGDEATPSTETAAESAGEPAPETTELAQSDYTQQDADTQASEEENAFDSFDTREDEF
jgi:hypothetical protein